jgi:hypothetical protein
VTYQATIRLSAPSNASTTRNGWLELRTDGHIYHVDKGSGIDGLPTRMRHDAANNCPHIEIRAYQYNQLVRLYPYRYGGPEPAGEVLLFHVTG